MKYVSTREGTGGVTASQAIIRGIAPDGGLYVPETIPAVDMDFIRRLAGTDYRERAVEVLELYLEEFSRQELEDIASASYRDNFDCPAIAPLRILDSETAYLELWHGPTSAFKDMALQIMPRLLTASLRKNGEKRTVSILVATSGDTGKAALEGFRDVPGTKIMVFYPRDGVSQVQKLQMTTQEGGNVNVVAVEGNFDDAQTGVKKIFGDRDFEKTLDGRGYFLSSANSINWGRLAPQIAYYFSAYCDMVNAGALEMGEKLDFCVPTGNFGDILAGWYAKRMGLPVGRLVCASNDNNVLTDFIATGIYDKNRPFRLTSSPSMDILVSSNLERLLYCLSGDADRVRDMMGRLASVGRYDAGDDLRAAVGAEFTGGFCRDGEARAEIGEVWRENGYLIDPHTAVASRVLRELRKKEGVSRPAVVVSTASPFKFGSAVLEALGAVTGETGPALVEELAAFTGAAAPKPLSGLGQKPVRFDQWVAKEDMERAVSEFLS